MDTSSWDTFQESECSGSLLKALFTHLCTDWLIIKYINKFGGENPAVLPI